MARRFNYLDLFFDLSLLLLREPNESMTRITFMLETTKR